MPSALDLLSAYSYIWRFDDPEEQNYATYTKKNDLISLRVFTISLMLIGVGFLIVDFNRPVDYFWVFTIRGATLMFYGALLVLVYVRDFSPNGIQVIMVIQIIVTYILYFIQASLAKMPFFFLPNVMLLFFYTAGTISGLRFRYAVLISLSAFVVFSIITEVQVDEYHRSQYPNLVANLIISMISAGFIEKQKRKDFMQFTELLLRKDELDMLNDQKNRVISILSHDVSAPLRSISGLLTTYERSQITKEELDRFLPDVKARVDKVSLLVHSLVRWSRSQMKGFVVQKIDVNLELLIMDNIALIKPFLGEKKISLKVELEPGLSVHADHEMLNLVIRNLLSNAVKFTSSGNRILVRTLRRNDKIAVEVSNEGEPIPVAVIEKLFTFQIRSRQGTANETGTGLGLAMSQQFANLNGGRIFLERQASSNIFCIELPSS